MRHDISVGTLGSLNPQNIRLYLSSRGWTEVRSESAFDVFEDPVSGHSLVVPGDRGLKDYARRVEDVIDALSESYGESPDSIFAGMTMSSSTDTISYRYEPDSGESGLIPVADLERILRVGSDINAYAYRDLCDFRPRYGGTRWEGRRDLDRIRVGPTLPGSYVVQFVYPASGDGAIRSTLDGGMSPEDGRMRLLCDKIETSLGEVIDAAERGRTALDPELRISYDFVSAVSELTFAGADVEIRRTRTAGAPRGPSRPMNLSRAVMRNIASLERGMRPPESGTESTLVGRLLRVDDLRETAGDEPVTMRIKYLDERDDRIGTARFAVSGDDADAAYDAAKARRTVSVSGRLVGPARSRRLEDVTSFRVLDRGYP